METNEALAMSVGGWQRSEARRWWWEEWSGGTKKNGKVKNTRQRSNRTPCNEV